MLALAAGLPAAAAAPAAAGTTTYTVTNLGSLGGGYTVGAALNNNGQVTGYSATAATITFTCGTGKHRTTCTEHPDHAFVWSNGTMTDLGTLGGNDSAGKSINLSGEVVGWAQNTSGSSHSVLWSGGKMTDLTAAGLSGSVAWSNDSGQIVGGSGPTGQGPFLDSNGTITQLPLPNYGPATEVGTTTCSAIMINNNGVVLGGCSDPSSSFSSPRR